MRAKPQNSGGRRWWRWGLPGGALLFVALVVGLWHGMPRFAERALVAKAAEYGLALDLTVKRIGARGARASAVRIEGAGFEARSEAVEGSWTLGEALGRRLQRLEIGQLEAAIDMAHWWPAPSPDPAAMLDPDAPIVGWSEALRPAAPETGAAPVALVASSRVAEMAEAEVGGGVELDWGLPLTQLAAPAATVLLRYGGARLPLAGDVHYERVGQRQALAWNARGDGFALDGVGDFAGESGRWSVQADWAGRSPLELAEAFFPPGHPAHPAQWLPPMVTRFSSARWDLGLLATGEADQLGELSALGEAMDLEFALAPYALRARVPRLSFGAALRGGQPERLQLAAEVAAFSALSAEAEPFQVSAGWSATGGVQFEIPRVRWTRGSQAALALALRGSMPPTSGAEMQLSILEAAWGPHSLAPFRCFVREEGGGLRGRLSTLKTPAFEGWRLVEGQLDLEGVALPGRPPATGEWEAHFRSLIEHGPKANPLGWLHLRLRPGPAATHDTHLEWTGPRGKVLGQLGVRVAAGGGFAARGEGRWSLGEVVPGFAPAFPLLRGLTLGGSVGWTVAAESDPLWVAASGWRLLLEEVFVHHRGDDWKIDGVRADLQLLTQGFLVRSQGEQEIRLDRISLGQGVIENVLIRFQWIHRHEVRVQSIEGDWMGGQLSLDGFVMDPFAPRIDTVLRFRNVNAVQLLGGFEGLSFRVEGRLDGALPVQYGPGEGFTRARGRLEARATPQAVLFFENEQEVARFLRLPETLGARRKAIEAVMNGIYLDSFVIDLFDPSTPRTFMTIDLSGRPRSEEIVFEGIRLRSPQKTETPLESWKQLALILSGGAMGR